MKERIKHLILFTVIVGIDQAVKLWVRRTLMNQDPINIIPGVLSLQYHENTGAVWGIMEGKVQFLSIFTLFILAFITFLYFKIPQSRRFKALRIITVFILAGAVGNLIDRIFLGHVIDFIYFEIINFPLFNIADSCLTISCILLFILAVFYYKDEDLAFLEQIFRKKKISGDVFAEGDTASARKDNSDADGMQNDGAIDKAAKEVTKEKKDGAEEGNKTEKDGNVSG